MLFFNLSIVQFIENIFLFFIHNQKYVLRQSNEFLLKPNGRFIP